MRDGRGRRDERADAWTRRRFAWRGDEDGHEGIVFVAVALAESSYIVAELCAKNRKSFSAAGR